MATSCPLVKDDLSDENIQPYLDMVLKQAELETKKVAEIKFAEFKNRLKDLETAYSTAVYELQTHMEKVISLMYSWEAEFKKDLDSCFNEEESKIKKEIEYLKQLQDSLSKGISDTKVAIGGSGEWMRGDTVDQQHSIMKANNLTEVIYNIVKIQVKDVPPLRFIAKELETNMLCEKDRHLLGHISTLSVIPSDLYLACIAISHENFIYKITVPEGVEDKEGIQDRIKCELKQGEKMPVYMNPIQTSKNFELKFECSVHESHTVSAFLFNQHINGSPAVFMPTDLISNEYFVKEERIAKQDPSLIADSENGCSEVDETDEEEEALDFSYRSVHKVAFLLQDVESEFQKNKNFLFEKQIYCLPLQKQVKTSLCDLRRGQSVVKIDRKLRPKNPLRRPNHAMVKSEIEAQKLSKLCDSGYQDTFFQQDLITDSRSISYLRNEKEKENITEEFTQCASTSIADEFNKKRANLVFKAFIPKPDSLHKPVGVVQLSSGEIVVADTFNDRIVMFNENGTLIKSFTSSLGLHQPSAVVKLEDDYIAVKDNLCITIFDSKGSFCKAIGKGAMQRPYGLSMNIEGQLMTVNTHSSGYLTILTICPRTGTLVSRVELYLNLMPKAIPKSKPRFITCYEDDKILVVDLGLNCVYVVNFKTGQLLNAFGEYGSGKGQLSDPSGIACDANGNIYVADSRNHRVQIFDSAQQFICILEMDSPISRPSGICLTANDHLLVLNYWENSLAKYHLTTRVCKY